MKFGLLKEILVLFKTILIRLLGLLVLLDLKVFKVFKVLAPMMFGSIKEILAHNKTF